MLNPEDGSAFNPGDYSALEPIYCDGVHGVVNLGVTFMLCFFRYGGVRARESGVLTYEKVPAIAMIRPHGSWYRFRQLQQGLACGAPTEAAASWLTMREQ